MPERFLLCHELDTASGPAESFAEHASFDEAVAYLKAQARQYAPHPTGLRAIYRERDGQRVLALKADNGLSVGKWVDRFTWDGAAMCISGYGGGPPFSIVYEELPASLSHLA